MEKPKLEITASRNFLSWLSEQSISLAWTTYQTGKLFLLGLQEGRLSIFERTFNRCMGLWADSETIWMSSRFQLWRFQNALAPGQSHNGYDRLYVPQVGYTTGDLDVHDISVDAAGEPLFVNTLFSCLATVSHTHSFIPHWQPPFISRLAAEDRCHLNGLAMEAGVARFVTAVSQSDVADGWRDRRTNGGCLIDVTNDAVVVEELSMPHSPRCRDDYVWLLESGTGFLVRVRRGTSEMERVTFCPGYLRGLCFSGKYAVIGMSLQRNNRTLTGLALEDNLQQRNADCRCGLSVVDIETGEVAHWLRIEGVVQELYDVVVLPDVRRPMALGFQTDEIHHTISVGGKRGD